MNRLQPKLLLAVGVVLILGVLTYFLIGIRPHASTHPAAGSGPIATPTQADYQAAEKLTQPLPVNEILNPKDDAQKRQVQAYVDTHYPVLQCADGGCKRVGPMPSGCSPEALRELPNSLAPLEAAVMTTGKAPKPGLDTVALDQATQFHQRLAAKKIDEHFTVDFVSVPYEPAFPDKNGYSTVTFAESFNVKYLQPARDDSNMIFNRDLLARCVSGQWQAQAQRPSDMNLGLVPSDKSKPPVAPSAPADLKQPGGSS